MMVVDWGVKDYWISDYEKLDFVFGLDQSVCPNF
jgi:hypothetical protein